jgi:hypothetical protein
MARNDGYAALMVRHETKDRFVEVKKHIEKQTGMTDMGIAMTVSQAVEYMCNKIMSDITKNQGE